MKRPNEFGNILFCKKEFLSKFGIKRMWSEIKACSFSFLHYKEKKKSFHFVLLRQTVFPILFPLNKEFHYSVDSWKLDPAQIVKN